jgi:HD-like signal output (HDOD) protein
MVPSSPPKVSVLQQQTPVSDRPFDFAEALRARVASGNVKVPPFPGVAMKLNELLHRKDYGVQEVAKLVAGDPTLAVEVIRCSNSAFYGRGEINSLQPAILRVGVQEVARLAVVSSLATTNRTPGPLAKLRRRAWQDAIAGAFIAQLLARSRRLSAENAFLCGLLHDFGWLLGLQAAEELLKSNPRETARAASDWAAAVEQSHVEFGVQLAVAWKLPSLLRDVIALHHSEDAAQSPHGAMVELVRATDRIVQLIWTQPSLLAEDLAALPSVGAAEATRIAPLLPDIPSVIDSFGKEVATKPVLPKVQLAPRAEVASGELVATSLPVVFHNGKRRTPYEVTAIGARAWTLHGKDPLQDGLLLDVELGADGAKLRHWARSHRCTLAVDGFDIECRPLLLSEAGRKGLDQLVRAAEAQRDLRLAALSPAP